MAPKFVYRLNKENTAEPFTQLLGEEVGRVLRATSTGNTGSQAPWWLAAVQLLLRITLMFDQVLLTICF